MAWFKVDDKLHDHGKARKARKAAMGVWVLAGSWCMFAETDGFVPEVVLSRWGSKRDAQALVDAGFWDVAKRDGEDGWQFHDWHIYQPDARTLQLVREAESKAGSFGNHKRWHTNRKVRDPECEFCKESK
jgi:hypothetical protein